MKETQWRNNENHSEFSQRSEHHGIWVCFACFCWGAVMVFGRVGAPALSLSRSIPLSPSLSSLALSSLALSPSLCLSVARSHPSCLAARELVQAAAEHAHCTGDSRHLLLYTTALGES